jgi:succinate dehydrogenase/fumarate reductase cytochrome b subunit
MRFSGLFFGVFKVSYCVAAIFWVSVLALRMFPPADGNYARQWVLTLALSTIMVIIAWAFLPWPRLEVDSDESRDS